MHKYHLCHLDIFVFEQIDKILKYVTGSKEPFGGKQIILFGDLFQLPPVAKFDEKSGLEDKYDGIFFFNSNAYKKGNFKFAELEQIFRQDDARFIEILNNIREGKGKEDTVEYSYEGDFKNDTKEGKGKVYYFLTKDRYEGEFKDNSITGFGLYTWANNHTYKGEFLLQQMNGEGVYTYPDGGYYKGHYVNNIKEGYGEFKWKNGKIFRGNFKNGKPYGKGILINNGEEKEVNFNENGQ